jgi:hypothetical protein
MRKYMKLKVVLFTSLLVFTFYFAARAGEKGELNVFNGCVCSIDQAENSLKILPWNNNSKEYDYQATEKFSYNNETKIDRQNDVTIADLKSGKPVYLSYKEVKDLSGFVGMRAKIYWVKRKEKQIVKEIEWLYGFGGETVKVNLLDPATCPCSSK